VHPRQAVPAPLLRLSLHQAGVVTREQALGLDVSRHVLARLVSSGSWRRISSGVFHTLPSEPAWDALAWAGVLIGGPHARLGGESSGHVYGLITPSPLPVDILVPLELPVARKGPWRFRRETVGIRSPRTIGSPPRLTASDTILDLAASRAEGEVVNLVVEALRRSLSTPDRLLVALGERPRQRHRALLAALLADAAGIESTLELDYLQRVERPHGLPVAARQGSSIDLPYRHDVEYRGYDLLVELDGRVGHDGSGRFRDMRRDNRHLLRGAVTLRYGWFDVRETPCLVAYQVYLALAARGYLEPFHRCPRCKGIPEKTLKDLAA
jgi:hypothetical protein